MALLKGLDPILSPDLLWVLAAMGHGDDLAVIDANFPAEFIATHTATRRLVRLPGLSLPRVLRAVLSVLPIDDFTPDPIRRMEVVGDATALPPVQSEAKAECDRATAGPSGPVPIASVERFAFYEVAKRAFAVVQAGEPRAYGCFLLRKGVLIG